MRLGELKGEAPRISQDAREAGVRRTSVRVSASSQQLAYHHSPRSLRYPNPGHCHPRGCSAERRGPGPPLHPLPFNPRTAAVRSCAAGPAGLGDLHPSTPSPPRWQEGGDTVVSAACPAASYPSLGLQTPAPGSWYNREPGGPGSAAGTPELTGGTPPPSQSSSSNLLLRFLQSRAQGMAPFSRAPWSALGTPR